MHLDATSLHPASDAEFLHSFAFAHIGIQLSDPGSEQNLTYKFPLGDFTGFRNGPRPQENDSSPPVTVKPWPNS